ncbi:MAG: cell division protein ZapE [Pseudomonadota bacterium]
MARRARTGDEAAGGGPLARYRAMKAAGELRPDAAQRAALEKLQLFHLRLARGNKKRSVFGRFAFTPRGEGETGALSGLYLYGGVGRGKSMLMDLFFAEAPVAKKRRVHFHAFMQEIHAKLHQARQSGASDPLTPIAAAVAAEAELLCFDELQVTDIADAMIIGRLFEELFKRRVAMVATSNRHPRELYKDGLQRERFLPFIALIEETLDVHELDGGADHRLEGLRGQEVYHAPLGPEATAAMEAHWAALIGPATPEPLTLTVQGRAVVLDQFASGAARCDFKSLCGAPLGPGDYLAIAGAARTLLLDDIPLLGRERANEAKRFVTLIDALYEAKTQFICSAAAEPDDLYPEGDGAFEFQRTASRLWEMRSDEWRQAGAGAAAALGAGGSL